MSLCNQSSTPAYTFDMLKTTLEKEFKGTVLVIDIWSHDLFPPDIPTLFVMIKTRETSAMFDKIIKIVKPNNDNVKYHVAFFYNNTICPFSSDNLNDAVDGAMQLVATHTSPQVSRRSILQTGQREEVDNQVLMQAS